MLKKIDWGKILRDIILALLGGLAGAGAINYSNTGSVMGSEASYGLAPIQTTEGVLDDGGSDRQFSALYEVRVYGIHTLHIGGGAKPEYEFKIPVYADFVVKIHGDYSSEKVRRAVGNNIPYGAVFDRVWNKKFVMWIKRPNESGDVPTPQDPETE